MICLPQPSGLTCAPQGVVGGKSGSLGNHWLEKHIDPTVKTQLRSTDIFQVEPGENWVALTNGGGGYGDPLERDPELVRDDARNYFISMKAARDEYGVVLNDKAELYDIDYKATEKLRAQLRKEGGAK
jgi:N-methylhydantoinase B